MKCYFLFLSWYESAQAVVYEIKIQRLVAVPGLPDGVPAAVTTVPAEPAPAVAVRGEGEPTGVDGLDGKLLLV